MQQERKQEINRTARCLAAIVYALGSLIVAVLAALVLLRVKFVPFPDAMLPKTLGELAVGWLALGALPMAGAAWAVYKAFDLAQSASAHRSRLLLALPALVCGICLAYHAALLLFMLAQGLALAGRG